jgi:hypothetical protein
VEAADLDVWFILIDEAKAEYIARKGVYPEDVQEVHDLAPRYFLKNAAWGLYNMIGPNRDRRFLVVSITHQEGTTWRLITAYWNGDGRARKIYEA